MLEQMKRAAALLAVGTAFSSGAYGQEPQVPPDLDLRHPGPATRIATEYFSAPDGRLVEARKNDADGQPAPPHPSRRGHW